MWRSAAVRRRPRSKSSRAPPAAVSVRPPGLWAEPFDGEEGMSTGDESTMVMEPEITPPLVVVQAQLPFQLPVAELDGPAQTGQRGQAQ